MSDSIPRPGDTDNNLLRKILDRLNTGITLFGEQGELPLDVEIVAVANFPVNQQIYGNVGVTNFPASFAVNNFPGAFSVNNFPASFAVNNFPATQPVSGTIGVNNFPASQTVNGLVNTIITDAYTSGQAHVTNFNQLHVTDQVRLAGTAFGLALDANFWTPAVTGSATATVATGLVNLRTNATANSTAAITTLRTARHIGNTQNVFRTVLRTPDTGAANNTRRWGAFDANNGFFFELSNTTLRVGRAHPGGATTIDEVNWNGVNTFVFDDHFHAYEIHYSISKAYFYIDGSLVHTFSMLGGSSVLSQSQNVPVTFQNINANGGTADVQLTATHGIISRLGSLATNNKYANISSATTTVLKLSAGRLYKLVIGNPAGNVTIYDNITNAAPIISTISLGGASSPSILEFDVGFNTGLTIVTSSASVNLTAIYE